MSRLSSLFATRMRSPSTRSSSFRPSSRTPSSSASSPSRAATVAKLSEEEAPGRFGSGAGDGVRGSRAMCSATDSSFS